MSKHSIQYRSLSQEDFVECGAFNLKMAIKALKTALVKFEEIGRASCRERV